jgi:hypothetical protein
VTHRPIARQRLNTHAANNTGTVFSVACHTMQAKHILAYAVTSHNRKAVFSTVVRVELLKDNRRDVFRGPRHKF